MEEQYMAAHTSKPPLFHLKDVAATHVALTQSCAVPQIYCLFLFVTGACLFGTLISQLNDILQAMSRKTRALESHLEGYISFMSEYR